MPITSNRVNCILNCSISYPTGRRCVQNATIRSIQKRRMVANWIHSMADGYAPGYPGNFVGVPVPAGGTFSLSRTDFNYSPIMSVGEYKEVIEADDTDGRKAEKRYGIPQNLET